MKCETNLLQDMREFNNFLELIKKEKVSSYLEIGSKHGGSFWRITNTLPKGSRVVSVDWPNADGSFKNSRPNLIECVDALKKNGYDAHLFLEDSTNPKTVEAVGKLGPFDLIFIDGNHTEPFIKKDWKNYGPMSRNMVAFHDISWRFLPHKDRAKDMGCFARQFWGDVKQQYKHVEFCYCEASNGIGVLWQNRPIP